MTGKKKKCYFFIYKEVNVSPQSKLLKNKKKKKKKTGNIAQIWDFYQRLGNIKSALVQQFFFFS